MAFSNATRPVPAVAGNRPRKLDRLGGTTTSVVTPPARLNQVLAPAVLMEWAVELDRRLRRSWALLDIGLPDPGFELLEEEVFRFNQVCLARTISGRAAA